VFRKEYDKYMTKEVRLYYTSDGHLLTEGSKNKIPILTKLSNYVYKLILVTPISDSKNVVYAMFEKSNGEVSEPKIMSFVGTENVIIKNEQQEWNVYSCYIEDEDLSLPTVDKTNKIKIGFTITFDTGNKDENGDLILGKFNYIPYTATCVYTITSRQNSNDYTSVQKVIDYLKENYYNKIEVEELFKKYITDVLNEPS
jgi:hypothetical protein